MRILFLICIIFSLINGSVVFPIYRKHGNHDAREQDKSEEKTIERRECSRYKTFVGSNLFDGSRKVCFSPEDVNLLVARRQFEIMIPKELPQTLLDEKSLNHILRYFYYGFWILQRLEDSNSRQIMEKAFYDTLGGFLRFYLVPVTKFSYYASKVELRTVRNVLLMYRKCRDFLNTNGNGWRSPMRNPIRELKSVKINPIRINDEESTNGDDKVCSDLDLTPLNNGIEVVDDLMIVPLPKIDSEDNEGALNNIWLPFLRKRTYNLRSCKSAFILLKFYRSVIRCYKKKSLPQKCFDRNFRQWIVENVKMHLSDEEFYPALGGILNVYENTIVGEPVTTIEVEDGGDDDDESLNGVNTFDHPEVVSKIKKRDLRDVIFNEEFVDDKVPTSFGDRNLDDWLRQDPDDELPQRHPRNRHLKCRKKCKKRKKVNNANKGDGKTTASPPAKDEKTSEKAKEKQKDKPAKPPKKEKPKKPEIERPVVHPGAENDDSFCKMENIFWLAAIILAGLLGLLMILILCKVFNIVESLKSRFGGSGGGKGGKKSKDKKKPKKAPKGDKKKAPDAKKKEKEAKKAAKKKEKEAKKKAKEAKKKGGKKDKKKGASSTSKGKDSKKADKEAKAKAKKAEKEAKARKKKAEKEAKKRAAEAKKAEKAKAKAKKKTKSV